MIDCIDLNEFDYVFQNKKFQGLKKINYIYGKNGVGKSSLVKAIKEQYGEKYNICIFQGFEQLFGHNKELDAIALGEDNKKSEKIINHLEKEIKLIDEKILEPVVPNPASPNLYEQKEKNIGSVTKKEREIDSFKKKAAKRIKDAHVDLTGASYSKNNFSKDITSAAVLLDSDCKKYQEILLAKVKKISKVDCPVLPQFSSLEKIEKAVNSILKLAVKPNAIISELEGDSDKKAFALNGTRVHSRKKGEHCAFCGNEITEDRWEKLDSFFSDKVNKLQERIHNGLVLVSSQIELTKKVISFDETKWQESYWPLAKKIQKNANSLRDRIKICLTDFEQSLTMKKSNLFDAVNSITINIPESFEKLQQELDQLWEENEKFNDNLEKEKKVARKKLRQHLVKKELESFSYDEKFRECDTARTLLQSKLKEIEAEEGKKLKLIKEKKAEIEKTKNETEAANEINYLIESLGNDSFELKHIEDVGFGHQHGLYEIMGHNGMVRSIDTLSTGEKNLLSFLWFLYHLKDSNNEDERKKVIIFDDPVNSNDDSAQYLIMTEIQELMGSSIDSQIILLTHNNHFYVQVRPTNPKYEKGNRAYFHLKRCGKTEIIKVSNRSNDLKTIYEDLWDELHFAYLNNRLTSMWNSMRRILETYGRFNFANDSPRNTEHKIESDVDKLLFLALLKSLNVNSHVGYETDIDLSDQNKESLLKSFRQVFISLGASKHYEVYWP